MACSCTPENTDLGAVLTISSQAGPFSADVVGADVANPDFRGALLYAAHTMAYSGDSATVASNVTLTVQGKDAASGQYFDIFTSTTNVGGGTSGHALFSVYDGAPDVANSSANVILPAVWRVKASVSLNSQITSLSLTVGANMIV